MKVITAPNIHICGETRNENKILCFLAGGITNCYNWQNEVIDILKSSNENLDNLVVFNPRQDNFDVSDKNGAAKQIAWEYMQLEKMDIFSIYFASGNSDQPICMYELGRNLCRMHERFSDSTYLDRLAISIEKGYKREKDVIIQTSLAIDTYISDNLFKVNINATPQSHADLIISKYKILTEI